MRQVASFGFDVSRLMARSSDPKASHEARALQARPDAAQLIAARYGLTSADAGAWLKTTRWSARVGVAASDLVPTCTALGALGVLPRVVDAAECIPRPAPRAEP